MAARRKVEAGFTLIELMVVVLIIGILAAIALPNFMAMENRAREGATKSNMHAFQLAAEDYAVQSDGVYANSAALVATRMPNGANYFVNPFDHSNGSGNAYEYQSTWALPLTTSGKSGIVAYGDSATVRYQIAGHGRYTDINYVLTSGSN